MWVPACDACGIEVQINALRHLAGHALSNAGVPPVVIKAFMGHASAAFSIDVYGHTSDADLDGAAELLAGSRDRSLAHGKRVEPIASREARGIAAGSSAERKANRL